jgi:two-component system KDP operon response regulator KdpE
VINLAARQVYQNGLEIYLTETEYDLLLELARHSNQVMLHEQLLTAVWGPKLCNEVDYLRSYIHVLRRKLENNPSQPKLIVSRPGIGYMLVSTSFEGSGN